MYNETIKNFKIKSLKSNVHDFQPRARRLAQPTDSLSNKPPTLEKSRGFQAKPAASASLQPTSRACAQASPQPRRAYSHPRRAVLIFEEDHRSRNLFNSSECSSLS
mmetsp:Transcript_13717/g.26564  ORF Transcript_13717/g.26564 Transcript_13717/m.26564 type:complete len:106 (-) Transcript_13717:174-491(-)